MFVFSLFCDDINLDQIVPEFNYRDMFFERENSQGQEVSDENIY
jgi:hypothetical protein